MVGCSDIDLGVMFFGNLKGLRIKVSREVFGFRRRSLGSGMSFFRIRFWVRGRFDCYVRCCGLFVV